jgi:hypothetical protein
MFGASPSMSGRQNPAHRQTKDLARITVLSVSAKARAQSIKIIMGARKKKRCRRVSFLEELEGCVKYDTMCGIAAS